MKSLVRIGLVGTGNRGVNYIGKGLAARDDVVLAALADPNPMRLQAARDKLGIKSQLSTAVLDLVALIF